MDDAATTWKGALSPNYTINVDKEFPYSEIPFYGQYAMIKIPDSNELVEHIDYWGEGRIVVLDGISGFPDCYNVNLEYKLVSKGGDEDKKIPNRIPVFSEEICDTSSYVHNNSVKLVTVTGETIVKSCAQDVARMVNSEVGIVVAYEFDKNSEDIKLLGYALRSSSLYYCPQYELSEYLRSITYKKIPIAFLNAKNITDETYNAVTAAQYDKAVEITKILHASDGGKVITAVLDKLFEHGIRYTTAYAYKLWNSGSKDIVEKYFPPAFTLIFSDEIVQIESNYYNMVLQLDAHVDNHKDRLAWGSKDSSDKTRWKLVRIWDNINIVFKIMNIKHTMFLKLDAIVDNIGDRRGLGSNSSNELRHTWTFEPKKWENEVVFFIVNREYDQALKLDAHTNKYGDRLLCGNNGNVYGNPRYFGWLFKAW